MPLPRYGLEIDFRVLFEMIDREQGSLLQDLSRARAGLKRNDDPERYRLILSGLDEMIASAFAQRDELRFGEGIRLIREFQPVANTRPPPHKEHYLNLLSLMIVTGPISEAVTIASDVRRAAVMLPHRLFGQQAEMLSALISLDRDRIVKVCQDLRREVEERLFSKATTIMAQLWAAAGSAMLERNGASLRATLIEIVSSHHQVVLKEARRWDKGAANSDFNLQKFLLAPEAALQAIGESAGLIEAKTISPYFDIEWMRKAV